MQKCLKTLPVFTDISRASYHSGVVPVVWKTSIIIPVGKSSSGLNDFRPITCDEVLWTFSEKVNCIWNIASYSRDGRYLLFYFRYDIDIFKPSIVDTDTTKLNWPLTLLKEYNQQWNFVLCIWHFQVHTHLEQWTHTHIHTHTHLEHCSLRRSSSTTTACNFILDSLVWNTQNYINMYYRTIISPINI